jgi:hypothetical protein
MLFFFSYLRKVHEREKRKYVCHLCGGKWTRGSNLTKHLVNKHQIYVPDCYNRYSYIRGEDGMYRMQLVRFEAVADEGVDPHAAAVHVEHQQVLRFYLFITFKIRITPRSPIIGQCP